MPQAKYTPSQKDWVVVGRFGRTHGVKGYVSVHAFTERNENLAQYENWHIKTAKEWRPIEVLDIKRQPKGLIALVVAVMMTLFVSVPAVAADFRSGADINVASGEEIDDDLYAAASDITIDGTINGDFWAVGQTITVNGTVNGSILWCAAPV